MVKWATATDELWSASDDEGFRGWVERQGDLWVGVDGRGNSRGRFTSLEEAQAAVEKTEDVLPATRVGIGLLVVSGMAASLTAVITATGAFAR